MHMIKINKNRIKADCVVCMRRTYSSMMSLVQSVTHLSERDDQTAAGLLFTGEADVISGDEHLSEDVHLVEGGPQRAARVTVQFLVFRQAEKGPVSLAFRPGVQIPEVTKTSVILKKTAVSFLNSF